MRGLLVAVAIFVLVASAWATETPVLRVESVYEIVTTWYPPFVEPARVDSTYLFTVTTDLVTGQVDTTGGR